jgi:hypothetical protein
MSALDLHLPARSSRLALVAAASLTAASYAGCGSNGNENVGSTSGSGGGATGTGTGGATASASSASSTAASSSSTTVASSSSTSGTGGGDPQNLVSVSTQSVLEAETHVAAAPDGHVAVAWIAEQMGGNSTNGYVFSADGGNTWGPVSEVASPGGRVASDPVLAIDQQNNFYMTWIGFHFDTQGMPYDMHVYAATAPAGTGTFGAPVEVTTPAANDAFDKPWITVTNKNTLLLTYAKTSTGGIYAARSVDQGKTWSNAVIVENMAFRNLVFPCVPATGDRVWATYHAGGGIGLRWSDDDGVTWPDVNKTAVAAMGETPSFDDPTCAAAGNEVWVSYGLTNDNIAGGASSPKSYAIKLAHSGDGGTTIDFRADAADTAVGKYFMHTQLAREAGGTLHLVYYAGQADMDTLGSFRRSASTDGGHTWGASVDVHKYVDFLQDRASPQWLGDYVGAWWMNNTLFMSYVDNGQGMYSHVAFAKAATP